MRDLPERLRIEDCKHGWLYRVYSRNLNLGIYRDEDHGFIGIRHKMGRRFLFTEFHWDTGPPFGTVNPLEPIVRCPIESLCERVSEGAETQNNAALMAWIDEQGQRLGITPESC